MDITKMLPFLEGEEVNELAKRILESENGEWKGMQISKVLPFLDSEIVDGLCRKSMENGQDYKTFLPFLSNKGMHEIVTDVMEGKLAIELDAMYPFMSKEDIKRVFYFCLEKEETKNE